MPILVALQKERRGHTAQNPPPKIHSAGDLYSSTAAAGARMVVGSAGMGIDRAEKRARTLTTTSHPSRLVLAALRLLVDDAPPGYIVGAHQVTRRRKSSEQIESLRQSYFGAASTRGTGSVKVIHGRHRLNPRVY